MFEIKKGEYKISGQLDESSQVLDPPSVVAIPHIYLLQ